MIGMNLRIVSQLEREAAQIRAERRCGLAGRVNCVSLNFVVAARDERAGTDVQNRYPSPVGRIGLSLGRPPAFFAYPIEKTLRRQRVAEFAPGKISDLAELSVRPRVWSSSDGKQKGAEKCKRKSGFWQWRPVRACRPVATPLASRRCSAPDQARQGRQCLTATSRQARLSGLRQTSPIVSNIRRAATKRATPAGRPDQNANPIVAPGCGGFFIAIAAGGYPRPRPEGTRNVQ
ncbi:hypothetical protein SAMN04488092_10543 [Thalassovita taeanensis]|uniref:Uncharacterized protein n=1 Tax=Thalassovita taeanensis TaxID=657014 RepID=A0A1H9EGN2_9RHOB|nr:hypothetical protein SAMN04488092_10543 [Thalassovita taeanensis]